MGNNCKKSTSCSPSTTELTTDRVFSYGGSHPQIDRASRPALKDLATHVIPRVNTSWYNLGLQLLDPKYENELDTIEADTRNDAATSCRKMFSKWLNTDELASWDKLITALRVVQLNNVANDIEELLLQGDAKDKSGSVTNSNQPGSSNRVGDAEDTVTNSNQPGSSSRVGDAIPTLQELLRYIDPQYTAHWKELARELGVEECDIRDISDNNAHAEKCLTAMLEQWQKVARPATWDKLDDALKNIELSSTTSHEEEGIHSATTSEPAITVKYSPLNVSRLKARYKKLLPTGKTDWPKHKVTQYVRLAIVKKEDVTLRDKHLNEVTRLTLQGDVDKILKKKEQLGDLKDIFHYNDEDCPRLILIMGGPGIGKTTLCHELCLRWARDGFLAEDFDAVALIPLRSVQQRSLEDAIMKYIGEENYQPMMKSAGRKCLLILEGFDEITIDRRQNDPFLLHLIKECTVLEEATILITSRPHACEKIDAGRRIEIVGFGNDEIRKFAKKSFPNDNQSVEKFLQQLDEYPQLHSLCYIPMNLVMLVDIFHCSEKKLPSTLTELYRLFIVMTLKRQVKKENVAKKPPVCSSVAVRAADSVEETLCVMLRGIPKKTVGIVLCLSKLAFRGFFSSYCHWEGEDDLEERKEPMIIFTESDLIQCDIEVTSDFDGYGLLKATPTHELLTDINTYSFNHLTVQEFLCAVYISLQSQQEQLHLLREHFHEYPNVFIFASGLTGLASSEMFQFIYSKLTSPLMSWRNSDVITALRCINESKQSSGPHQLVSPFTLDMIGNTLLPYDCVCVSHVLSGYPVLALRMRSCHIGNKGAELLVKHYPNVTGQLLEELDLYDNDLTNEGMEHLMQIVSARSGTLRVLNVSNNGISDDGMGVISETLQYSKSLTRLELADSGLSVKGAVYISQLLNVTHTLQELYMDYNNISDDGMAMISEALQHNKSLTTLGVAQCGLSVKGAISISKMMMVNYSLKRLYMRGNSISDDGISAIARALGNCKITIMNVERCNITQNGATSLAAALSSNHTIRELWLEGNAITVEGALLIVKSAVDNTVCQYVDIDYKFCENDEISKTMKILRDRKKLEARKRPEESSSGISKDDSCGVSEDTPLKELPLQSQLEESITETNQLKNHSDNEETRVIQNHQRIIPLSSKHTEGHCPHPSRSCEPLYHKLFWLKAFIFCRN